MVVPLDLAVGLAAVQEDLCLRKQEAPEILLQRVHHKETTAVPIIQANPIPLAVAVAQVL